VTTAGSPDAVREMTSAGTGGARLAPGKVEDACVSHGGEAENLGGHVCLRPLKRGRRGGVGGRSVQLRALPPVSGLYAADYYWVLSYCVAGMACRYQWLEVRATMTDEPLTLFGRVWILPIRKLAG
jgi:hypothetical protein